MPREVADVTWSDLIWVLIVIVAIQPMLRQRYLDLMRQRRIAQFEKKRGSRVILLIHRQETMRLLGFPLMRYIDVTDSEAVLKAIQLTDPDVPLDLVLHTPGGLALAALQIARALRDRKAAVTIFVPHYAMSGGTLIALAAREIVLSPHAVLGPIDPQIGEYPAASFLKVVSQKPAAETDDETLIKADLARKAITQMRDAVAGLLTPHLDKARIDEIATCLTDGRWTHDHPIFAEDAAAIGLNVSTSMPPEILQLMDLYPQPVSTASGGVEYLPGPRHRDAEARSASSRHAS
jgi:ClpP class serine protease